MLAESARVFLEEQLQERRQEAPRRGARIARSPTVASNATAITKTFSGSKSNRRIGDGKSLGNPTNVFVSAPANTQRPAIRTKIQSI